MGVKRSGLVDRKGKRSQTAERHRHQGFQELKVDELGRFFGN